MNIQDIRKAFNNWTGTPTTKLESDIEDYINKHTHRNDEFLTMYGYFNGYKDGVKGSEKQIAELLTEIECLNNRLYNNKIRVQEALSR